VLHACACLERAASSSGTTAEIFVTVPPIGSPHPIGAALGLALDDKIFSAESYKLPVPTMDGYKAVSLELPFSGTGQLDRTSFDDLELLEADRLGNPVRLIVLGESVG
jgi:hypothetical protein